MSVSMEDIKTTSIRIINHMLKIPSNQGYGSSDFREIIDLFHKSFFAVESPEHLVNHYRIWVANSVLSNDECPLRLAQIFTDLGKYAYDPHVVGRESYNEQYIETLTSFQMTLCNYLELSASLAEALSMQGAYLKGIYSIYEAISSYDMLHDDGILKHKITLLAEVIIKSLYNIVHHDIPVVLQAIRENRIIDVILYFVNFRKTSLQMASYLSLAYIYKNEDQPLFEESAIVKFFVNTLSSALKNPSERVYGYSCREILKGLRLLASNDQNKELLFFSTVMQDIQSNIKALNGRLLEECLLFLWTLSFNPAICSRIKSDFDDTLRELDTFYKKRTFNDTNYILRALHGLLWQLNQDDTPITHQSKLKASIQPEHVMISYCHEQKEMASNLTYHLKKNGYKVWFDKNSMKDAEYTFSSLAEAIEKSYVVCILFSNDYKQSEHTEREAIYATNLRKPIIWLRAQRDYQPDGWLGLITCRSNYIDISGKYPFETYFPDLCRRIDKYISPEKKV
ncbi:hypothetical protein MN116_007339 [Schistosoma mekongi]|uniref:TIR domain-containing protein n=1 Tax=Schistosoma mekongi TaxID=38744 RepID=A0AAE2D3H8_SCHME|nr:hypothetical protein MN116_007339 [Schistosoma mekongi]